MLDSSVSNTIDKRSSSSKPPLITGCIGKRRVIRKDVRARASRPSKPAPPAEIAELRIEHTPLTPADKARKAKEQVALRGLLGLLDTGKQPKRNAKRGSDCIDSKSVITKKRAKAIPNKDKTVTLTMSKKTKQVSPSCSCRPSSSVSSSTFFSFVFVCFFFFFFLSLFLFTFLVVFLFSVLFLCTYAQRIKHVSSRLSNHSSNQRKQTKPIQSKSIQNKSNQIKQVNKRVVNKQEHKQANNQAKRRKVQHHNTPQPGKRIRSLVTGQTGSIGHRKGTTSKRADKQAHSTSRKRRNSKSSQAEVGHPPPHTSAHIRTHPYTSLLIHAHSRPIRPHPYHVRFHIHNTDPYPPAIIHPPLHSSRPRMKLRTGHSKVRIARSTEKRRRMRMSARKGMRI
jgi:hypothetical protein